ncbi:MAG: hypothetical protein ACFFA8_06925 [Promethearchaeota archaeon]
MSNSQIVEANGVEGSLNINTYFELNENATIDNELQNTTEVNINLPSSSWQLNAIDLNFTNIEFGIDNVTMEDTFHGTYKRVFYKNGPQKVLGLAVQINLTEPSIIHGIYIYGYNGSHIGTPQIQLRGYDSFNNIPNNTVYGSTNLNISTTPGWYFQNFTTQPLNVGNYFLVLNGSSLPIYNPGYDVGFYWAYNAIDPLDNSLYTLNYTNQWNAGDYGAPFLYKLYRKLNVSFYPENNNMTIKINNVFHTVSNGSSAGEGTIKQSGLTFFPSITPYTISVYNNRSSYLKFDVSSKIYIDHQFFSQSLLTINLSSSNKWSITPSITRASNNYSVRFDYPSSWENLTVYKDQVNISSGVEINNIENYIFIPDDMISNGAEWEIQAYSPYIPLEINAPKTEYNLGQELRFSILNPIAGNYTFLLSDPSGFEEHRFSILNPTSDFIFSYEIPSNAVEGTYFAYLFFFNGTDAGVQYQQFNITISIPNNNNPLGLIILLISIIGAAIGGSTYIAVKKLSTVRRGKLESILNKCNDILNLQYIIVIENKSGIDIFSRTFAAKKLDTSLISGFLQAIRSFGTEVSEAAKDSRTVKLEYKDSLMLMTEFVNLRLITILKEQPSRNFLYLIEDLAYDIFKTYGNLIDTFSGNIKQFRGIDDLIEKHLTTSFLSPLKIDLSKHIKLSQAEKEMVDQAMKFMRENNFNYFYSVYLLPENVCTPKDYKTILDLLHKGVFTPTTKA